MRTYLCPLPGSFCLFPRRPMGPLLRRKAAFKLAKVFFKGEGPFYPPCGSRPPTMRHGFICSAVLEVDATPFSRTAGYNGALSTLPKGSFRNSNPAEAMSFTRHRQADPLNVPLGVFNPPAEIRGIRPSTRLERRAVRERFYSSAPRRANSFRGKHRRGGVDGGLMASGMSPEQARNAQRECDAKRRGMNLTGTKTFDDKAVDNYALWKGERHQPSIPITRSTHRFRKLGVNWDQSNANLQQESTTTTSSSCSLQGARQLPGEAAEPGKPAEIRMAPQLSEIALEGGGVVNGEPSAAMTETAASSTSTASGGGAGEEISVEPLNRIDGSGTASVSPENLKVEEEPEVEKPKKKRTRKKTTASKKKKTTEGEKSKLEAASASPTEEEQSPDAADGVKTPPEASKENETEEASKDGPSSTEQVVHVEPLMAEPPRDVFMVSDVAQARHAMDRLRELAETKGRVFACDTEVMNIDVGSESPCGHGEVICFSIYCGEDANFAEPWAEEPQQHLWVDVLDSEKWKEGKDDFLRVEVFEEFREFFENPKYTKCWHNYGFDRHVLSNPPFNMHCNGFAGDTMHMARLWDSSRKIKGYSLAALTSDPEVMGEHAEDSEKTSMKTIFGYKKIKKDGTEGKVTVMDPVENLQSDMRTRNMWIHYSARDAKATYHLREKLLEMLGDARSKKCLMDPCLKEGYDGMDTMWDLYTKVWLPFGELLTDMEKEGFYVDVDHLAKAETQAENDKIEATERFRTWAKNLVPDAVHMNVNSDLQIRTLFFAGAENMKTGEPVDMEKSFKCPNPLYEQHVAQNLPGKKPLKNMDFTLHSAWGKDVKSKLTPPIYTAGGWPASSAPALKSLVGKPGAARKVLEEQYQVVQGPDNTDLLDDGLDDEEEVQEEVQPEPTYAEEYKSRVNADKLGIGKLFTAFNGGRQGLEACVAVESLLEVNAIDTLLSSFILPLQEDNIKTPNGRIHASLNINTETGRLSCRRPNLQNQPALEKDKYKVRKAFMADRRNGKKNTLVVADYGQLELRVLAHLTNCKSMLEAFETGGDFHSRTALGMYDHIKKAVADGECLLEWDGGESGNDPPPVPLLKDKFASERRKAKVLNFSLAYGKTAHGLAKDWKVSKAEADETLERWYSDRKEVKQWQEETRKLARERKDGHYVTTLLGRRRNLPEIVSKKRPLKSHAERAAINTPIQGSAADIATAAMLCIEENERLKELGWKLLLQVHDEVILEGPEDSADEVKQIVIDCMAKPFPAPGGGYHNPLKVDLSVDCKSAHSWYEAK
ncbi:hypothetical protein BSKO_06948 [Bryopsis sp. KO-2023]|nr:hypothetical protein BSKO_06948 [Bryopsis sp. KO-2023]